MLRLSNLIQDFRFAARSMIHSPVFALTAILSLALGIGANTAIFSIYDQVLLRLLPVEDPESLVMIASRGSHTGSNRGANAISYPMYKDYRERNDVFTGVLCRRGAIVNFGIGESTERVEAELVSGNYFDVLGVPAAEGRLFSAQDETAPGANPLVVLNYDYWMKRFSGNRSIIGQAVRINNFPMTIVGVAARGFQGVSLGYRPNLHIPVTMKKVVTPSWDDLENRRSRWLQLFARLKPGVSREAAEASIQTLYKQIIQAEVKEPYFNNVPAHWRERFLESYAVVMPGGQGYSGMRNTLEMPVKVLLVLVVLVLVVACANVSNLLAARATSRKRELSVRMALGAGRGRIVQQLLVESLILSTTGALLGLTVAYWTLRGLLLLAPTDQAQIALSPVPDLRILGFSLAAAVISAILFGLLPAIQTSRTDLFSSLKEQSNTDVSGPGRMRQVLVISQVALSLLLLIGSGLFVQSLRNLQRVDPGFEATNLVRFKLDPMLSGYDVERTKQFYQTLQQRLESLPGVESTGLAMVAILENNEWDSTVAIEGYQSKEGENMNPHFNAISPGYFRTLSIPMLAGIDFNEQIGTLTRKAAVVNETFVEQYFGDRNPIGRHIGFGGGTDVTLDIEIVGVIRDTNYENLREKIPRQVFTSYRQYEFATEMTVYVRTSIPSSEMFGAVRREMRSLDPNMPLFDMNTMENQLDRSLAIEKFTAFLSGAFGVLATILAILGLYGVTTYDVERRWREIGIRMALGAATGSVLRLVLREVLLLALLGIGIGLTLTWGLTQFARKLLYGVEPRDAASFVVAVIGLLAVATLAGVLPAHRASRLNPIEVLHYE